MPPPCSSTASSTALRRPWRPEEYGPLRCGAGRFCLPSLRNLDQLPATGAAVIAVPLKIVNGSGSPLRVLALVEELAGSPGSRSPGGIAVIPNV